MKKKYIKPETLAIKLTGRQYILAGSASDYQDEVSDQEPL